MHGRTVVITGANSGIGLECAVALADLGADVAITARDPRKGEAAVAEILDRTGTAPRLFDLDLADLDSVRRCADAVLDAFDQLHVLVANAGLTLSRRTETVQGFEYLFGVNHLGHFELFRRLRERLVASAPARVVVVSSDMHRVAFRGLPFDDLQSERGYRSWDVYGKSKLANLLFVREAALRLSGTGVTVNAAHPGLVKTNFGGDGDTRLTQQFVRALPRTLALDAAEGAETIVHLAASPEVVGLTGGYFSNKRPVTPSRHALDDAAAGRLWAVSEELIDSVDRGEAGLA